MFFEVATMAPLPPSQSNGSPIEPQKSFKKIMAPVNSSEPSHSMSNKDFLMENTTSTL
jgi:hypothetical protein